ncbi:hypothetical protein ACFOLF_05765 [Paenibacillus sepulcri]|uniref:Uncharacterized protein n=1 Tax=Paenibacillus sepulcri TaxID=359917 RepID=A0ABS7BXE1_9BACL|nr:hypothetical protein [Paenibacillus sepulcri]
MSEFTSGFLTLNTKKSLDSLAEQSSVIKAAELNAEWLIFLNGDAILGNDVPDYVKQISMVLPVLYFYYDKDHCWGYKLFESGEMAADFELDYEAKNSMVIELAEKLYPDKDIIAFLYLDEEGSEIRERLDEIVEDNYLEMVRMNFEKANLDSFNLFHKSEDTINKLKNIMRVEYFQTLVSPHELVEEFKELIGISEMSR